MSYWEHTLLGASMIAAGIGILRHCRAGRRLRALHRQWQATQTDRERAARRIC